VVYAKVVVDVRPHKEEKERCRLVVGGDQIEYPYEVTTRTASIETAKIIFNSVISTDGAKFITLDLKDFYLNTPMARYEYIKIPVELIPDEIMDQYNLHKFVTNGHVVFEVRKGMYGLPQAGRIANEQLQKHLEPFGYTPCQITPGLWKHTDKNMAFAIVLGL
jgi:hypothetical protein